MRLRSEVPSLEAFDGAEGVIWRSFYEYDLMPDGTTRKKRQLLMLLAESASPELSTYIIPFPDGEGANLTIDSAAWYDAQTGALRGDLSSNMMDEEGIRYMSISIPDGAKRHVVAIGYTATSPMRYYLDDVLTLSGSLPIWEQNVSVEIPAGMDVYWEGIGVRTPTRERDSGGVEKIKWTLLNQPAWQDDGIVAEKAPTLLFSLQRGLTTHLKNLSMTEALFKAPQIPSSIASSGNNLLKAGSAILSYMRDRRLVVNGNSPKLIRNARYITGEGSWTSWEQTLIAGKWLQSLGFDVKVFWSQKLPVGASGASSSVLWDEPILKIGQGSGKDDIYFTSGQRFDFGKLDPSLYGMPIYRFAEGNIERFSLPKGSASEHQLQQMWRLNLSETGEVEGTLDLHITGGWVDVFDLAPTLRLEDVASLLEKKIVFSMPGLSLVGKSMKPTSSGYRFVFDLRAQLGIVSGTDILVKLPGGVPNALGQIPANGEGFAFKFPFILEQNAVVTTPAGYRTFMLPGKNQEGNTNATLESSVVHWPKRRRAETDFKWTVRNTSIDDFFAKTILEQARAALNWSRTSIPLRK
ncbi:hypothetical protein LJC31_01540 [Synergistaceae bacterium OttesenSCG-928-I11]|nr:hypothetical protein [Synergistaceae bacterium OttesenSCG-928-I11]